MTSGQRETVNEFIDVGEWGLAVETVSDFLYEYEIPISSETYQLIKIVSQELRLKDSVWGDLESQITDMP
ncbi:MAG: MafI family immunity protein [Leptolyngbya sp. SIOISBB]|nr:MafI family immunity protein [Leptolyngbya sp. SIOISBB]